MLGSKTFGMKELLKYVVYLGMLAAATPAFAIDVGQVARNITGSVMGVTDLAGAISYGAGVIFIVMAGFKLKAYKEDPRSTPLSTPVVLVIASMLFIYLPTTIETGRDTVWGAGGANTQGGTGQSVQIN